ncbi:MAG: hypothetical protein HUU50_12280 [Candidatus Brocadiae bacterium]|nr:hypothetical protein [Candidatus Brocadiia bacterium]
MDVKSPSVEDVMNIDIDAPIEKAIDQLLNLRFTNSYTKITYKRYLLRYCQFMEVKTLAEILDLNYQEVIDRCILFLGDYNPSTQRVMLSAIGVLFNYISKVV